MNETGLDDAAQAHTPVRIALVTGAARGLGQAICQRLAQSGVHCVLVDVAPEVEEAAAALSSPLGRAEACVVDVSDGAAVAKAMADLQARQRHVDILVNNAGIHPKHADGRFYRFDEIDRASWDRVMAINLGGAYELCRAVLPMMRERRWGRIVNISSRTARTWAASAGAHYAASKAGLIAMSRVIAGENGRFGITSNCIAPGPTASPMAHASVGATGRFLETVPAGRIGTPGELAATVAFLASDEAGYINGAIVDFNGGSFMP